MVKDTSEYEYRKKTVEEEKKCTAAKVCVSRKEKKRREKMKMLVTGHLPLHGYLPLLGFKARWWEEKSTLQGWHLHRYTPRGLYYQRELTRSVAPSGGSAKNV